VGRGGPHEQGAGAPSSGTHRVSSAWHLLIPAVPPNLRGLGGPRGGVGGPVPGCAPPHPHLPVQEGGDRRGRAQLAPPLAEGQKPVGGSSMGR
jgi:hypothetical protein